MRLPMLPIAALAALMLLPATVTAGENPASPRTEDEKAALEAAESWLALIDGGEVEKSWEEAASLFRKAIDAPAWSRAVKAARGPLGAVLEREVKSLESRTELPGAPDGEYVVIQFQTRFEHKRSAIETITPMLDDGVWRVSGYYVR